jgi:hypothetical protein
VVFEVVVVDTMADGRDEVEVCGADLVVVVPAMVVDVVVADVEVVCGSDVVVAGRLVVVSGRVVGGSVKGTVTVPFGTMVTLVGVELGSIEMYSAPSPTKATAMSAVERRTLKRLWTGRCRATRIDGPLMASPWGDC